MRRLILIALLSIGLGAFVVKLVLFYYYIGISPHIANQSTGQMCALNNHGDIVYITRAQDLWQQVLFLSFFVFCFGAALLNLRWKAFKNPSENMPKKLY